MKKTISMAVLFIFMLAAGCSGNTSDKEARQSAQGPAAPPRPALTVGVDPIEAVLLEQDTFNVPYWLENGVKGRTLVRISGLDGLSVIKKADLDAVKEAALTKKDPNALANMGDALWDTQLYSPESTVYVAHQLGLVDRLYWVVPRFGSITHEGFAEFKDYLRKSFPSQARDVESLKLDGKVVEGVFDGMPVTFVSLQDMPAVEGPVLLEVDLSFVSSLYANEKSTRILALVSGLYDNLKGLGLQADHVTVVASNDGGLVPLKFRFLTGYFRDLFKNPALIDTEPPAIWLERAEAWRIEQKSPRESIAVYKNILKSAPDDAATHYDLSYAYFMTDDMDSCGKELNAAAKLDPGYAAGFAEYAAMLAQKGKKSEAESFLARAEK